MALRNDLPRVVLRQESMRQLRPPRNTDSLQQEPENLHNVSTDWHPLVPDRVGATEGNGIGIPCATLHIALLVSNLRTYDEIKDNTFLIKPPLWDGEVKLHVLLKHPKMKAEDYVLRLAAVDLGLVSPSVAQLNDGQQLNIGWPTDEFNPAEGPTRSSPETAQKPSG